MFFCYGFSDWLSSLRGFFDSFVAGEGCGSYRAAEMSFVGPRCAYSHFRRESHLGILGSQLQQVGKVEMPSDWNRGQRKLRTKTMHVTR